jgi:hypothetical protein
METDGMRGPPCRPPHGEIFLRQVWIYLIKWEGILKARIFCDKSILKTRGLVYATHYITCIS